MKHAVWIIAIMLSAVAAFAADETALLRAWETITGDELARHVAVLASDEYQGREPGTAGERLTVDYIEKQFRAAGAAPGVGNSYRQRVPLVEVKRKGTPQLTFKGKGASMPLAFEDEFAAFAGIPSEAVALKGLPLVYVGHGITAEEYGWDDYEGVPVNGAAVILLRGEPLSDADTTLFRHQALTVHGINTTKYDNAAAHGARAAIVIHVESVAGFPWSIFSSGGIGNAQNFIDEKPDEPKLDLVMHISEEAGRKLFARAGLDLDEAMASAGRRGFHAMATGMTADMTYEASMRRIDSYNVVGMFRGSERPQEAVIYTAHWDHVGVNADAEGDKIFNGAIDNATGTAGLLELAEAFAAMPAPRRSVYLVATTAEEKGLLGSEYLARHPLVPLSGTVAVLNLDALFPFGDFSAMTVPAYGSSEVEDVLAASAARLGRVLQDDSAPQVGAYYRSDHYPFAKRGVPAVFAVGGPRHTELTEESPMYKRFSDYLQNGYHKPADEYDAETWDMRGIEGDIRIFFETGWTLADGSQYPNWRAGNEFRALRDRMRTP